MPDVDIIFKGEDKTITITITDANDDLVDLDDAPEIIVRLLDESKNTIEKYSKTTQAGFRDLDIPDPASGEMNLFLNAAQTDVAARGFMSAEIKMEFVDVNFDDSTLDAVTTIPNLALIKESTTLLDL